MIEFHSTKTSVREFKESVLWKDIVRALEDWKEGFEDEKRSIVETAADENPSTANVLLHFGDINGREKAIDYLLELPDMIINALEVEKTDTENGG